MKQVELAQQLGISKSYLSMILSGQRTPNPELARKLSSLGVHKFEPSSSLRGSRPTTRRPAFAGNPTTHLIIPQPSHTHNSALRFPNCPTTQLS